MRVGWGWDEVWFVEILFKLDGPGPYPELDAGGGGVQLVPSCHTLLGGVQFTNKKKYIFLWHPGGYRHPNPPPPRYAIVKTIIQKGI